MTTRSTPKGSYVARVAGMSQRRIWTGRMMAITLLVVAVIYMARVGLSTASMLGGAVGGVATLVALIAPYLWPRRPSVDSRSVSTPHYVQDTGVANATNGGAAITGTQVGEDSRPLHVHRSGDACAYGSGSVAVSGIQSWVPEDHDR